MVDQSGTGGKARQEVQAYEGKITNYSVTAKPLDFSFCNIQTV